MKEIQTAHKIEACAAAAHEANRAYCRALGDYSQEPWDEASPEQRRSCRVVVVGVFDGNNPEQSHESWLLMKKADAWVYGEKKDEHERTHPCMVPYEDLPPEQRAKDHLFVAVVQAVADAVARGCPTQAPDEE